MAPTIRDDTICVYPVPLAAGRWGLVLPLSG